MLWEKEVCISLGKEINTTGQDSLFLDGVLHSDTINLHRMRSKKRFVQWYFLCYKLDIYES